MSANQSVLDFRRRQRQLWNLDLTPRHYDTVESYAQPQQQDWPVYDPDQSVYVPWSPELSHLESMVQLSAEECKQLRCVSIFTKDLRHEYGKSGKSSGATFNYKRKSIAMGKWEETVVGQLL